MKKCLFCDRENMDTALQCWSCKEVFPVTKKKEPWYFKAGFQLFAFCCVGPLMLPLIWFHPTYARKTKIVWTIVITVISLLMLKALMATLGYVVQYYSMALGGKLPAGL